MLIIIIIIISIIIVQLDLTDPDTGVV